MFFKGLAMLNTAFLNKGTAKQVQLKTSSLQNRSGSLTKQMTIKPYMDNETKDYIITFRLIINALKTILCSKDFLAMNIDELHKT